MEINESIVYISFDAYLYYAFYRIGNFVSHTIKASGRMRSSRRRNQLQAAPLARGECAFAHSFHRIRNFFRNIQSWILVLILINFTSGRKDRSVFVITPVISLAWQSV